MYLDMQKRGKQVTLTLYSPSHSPVRINSKGDYARATGDSLTTAKKILRKMIADKQKKEIDLNKEMLTALARPELLNPFKK